MPTDLTLDKIKQITDAYCVPDALDLAEEYIADGICPSVCMNPTCDFITDMEPDQDAGYCEECGTNSVKSLMILLGVI